MLRALDILIDSRPVFSALPAARKDVKKTCEELFAIARRIQTRHYHRLGEKLIEFALKDVRHTEEGLDELIDKMKAEISKPFDVFHRREKKFFEKVAKEHRNMGEEKRGQKKAGND